MVIRRLLQADANLLAVPAPGKRTFYVKEPQPF